MKKIILICFLITSSVNAWETYTDTSIKSWIGYPLDSIIKQWGYPDEEKTIAGKKLYIWLDYDYSSARNTGGLQISSTSKNGSKTSLSFGGDIAVDYCKKTMEVNENNIIINGYRKGNSCPLLYGNRLMNKQK